ncbi:MAG TPA: hypothetical protein PLM56_03905 [Cyclobacteriaceae bacterium]|jgi:hypothetical protein|nr:hypothetical protein [Cytophagales bacterium]HNT50637.1 hypothetical protein [Cyclobacteriaceae bacterium]HRE65464.1 hypothetical protein [Cyclobacteriaceae bacterium]HRF32618.1 hypothetical protein [Cyclobacteriaceae bacterium]
MVKIVFSYVAIFCLLILVSANTITTSIKKANAIECADLAEETETQQVPSPVEEDISEDDENSKLLSGHANTAGNINSQKLSLAGHFLTDFHFLEIISPPPQA